MRINIILFFLMILMACKNEVKVSVIATSSWTAAYVKAAGISNLSVLAPPEMQHPSEYELDIDDIEQLRHADLIVCGGYEIIMDRIRNGLKIDTAKILQIKTDYNLENIRTSILAVASKMGTEAIAMEHLDEIEQTFKSSRERIRKAGIEQHPLLVQFFIQPLAHELDLNVSAVFGPRPLEVFDIGDLLNQNFSLILDNAHNPVSAPLVKSKLGVKVAYLINFPGKDGTASLVDVIQYNVDRIIEASEETE